MAHRAQTGALLPDAWQWLASTQGLATLEHAADIQAVSGAAGANVALRREGLPPDRVAALLKQVDLRARAVRKFGPTAARLLFTPAGLEQATRCTVADARAARLAKTGRAAARKSDEGPRGAGGGTERRDTREATGHPQLTVADLGCGIGGEAMALLRAGIAVEAVEIDPLTATFADHNLHEAWTEARQRFPSLPAPVVHTADVAEVVPALADRVDAVIFDPARRTSGHRETRRVSPDAYSPPLDLVWRILAQTGGVVKLGPGFPHEAIPGWGADLPPSPHAGAHLPLESQWVSVDGAVVELAVWVGSAARRGAHTAATVVRGDAVSELSASSEDAQAPVRTIGRFLHEPDGAVIRARLMGRLARQIDAGVIDPHVAYLTTDAPVESPLVQSFRIVQELPFREKALKHALRELGIGQLEIKKRGVEIDPALLLTGLGRGGDRAATLILTRVGERRLALLTERLPAGL